MKRHLNTLYITTQGAYLAKDGETVEVRIDGEVRLKVPIHTLASIVCFGAVSVSPFALGLCGQRGVGVSFLSERGRFLARMEGPTRGNVLLRREQYRRADDLAGAAAVARPMVVAKVANARAVLLRAARNRPEEPQAEAMRSAAAALGEGLTRLGGELELEELRGVEGTAARIYFGVFDHLITREKDSFFFRGRSRRPPGDRMNALLSFLYTLLRHDVEAACESVGLDPAVGFLHRDRPGRPSLALDLMEELRPYLADRLALTLVNRGQLKSSGFTAGETGGCFMDEATRKVVLVAYQERKQEEVEHPFLGEKTTVGLLPHLQALLLARHLRGDLDGYPPFLPR